MKKLLVILFALGAMSAIVAGCAPAAEPAADAPKADGATAEGEAAK